MQGMFRMCTVARNGRGDLFVDNDVDLDPRLGPPLKDLIQSPFLIEIWGSSQEEFWTQPPVFDVDDLFCLLQGDTDGPEVVAPVDVPFDLVAFSFRCKGLEAVGFGDALTFGVSLLLVLFVVAVIGVDEVMEFADFGLEMVEALLCLVQIGVCKRTWVY